MIDQKQPKSRKPSWEYLDTARKIEFDTPATKAVLLHLGITANDEGKSWHSIPSIAFYCCTSQSSVYKCLAELKTLGLVTWKSGGGRKTNHYYLSLKALRSLIKSQGYFGDDGLLIRIRDNKNPVDMTRFNKKAALSTAEGTPLHTGGHPSHHDTGAMSPVEGTPLHSRGEPPRNLQNHDTTTSEPEGELDIQAQVPESFSVLNGDRKPDEEPDDWNLSPEELDRRHPPQPCPYCPEGKVYYDPDEGYPPHCGKDECERAWFEKGAIEQATERRNDAERQRQVDDLKLNMNVCINCRCPKEVGKPCQHCIEIEQETAKFDREEAEESVRLSQDSEN
jgi:hypothetical protein